MLPPVFFIPFSLTLAFICLARGRDLDARKTSLAKLSPHRKKSYRPVKKIDDICRFGLLSLCYRN